MLEQLPSHPQSLQYCRSMTRRRRVRLQCSLSSGDMKILKAWTTSKDSSILISEARGIKTSSRDFAADLIDALLEVNIPAIWSLPSSIDEEGMTLENLLMALIMQTVSLNPCVLSDGVNPVSVMHFKATRTIDDWFRIFQRCLRGLKRLFIILDLILISKVLKKVHSLELEEFIDMLDGLCHSHDGILKIVALTWRTDTTLYRLSQASPGSTVIGTDPGARKVRLMRNPKYRTAFVSRRQGVSDVLKDIVGISS